MLHRMMWPCLLVALAAGQSTGGAPGALERKLQETFQFDVTRGDLDEVLGITVLAYSGTMKVTQVDGDGAVKRINDLNLAKSPPGPTLQVDDSIIKVNSAAGDTSEMSKVVVLTQNITLTVSRTGAGTDMSSEAATLKAQVEALEIQMRELTRKKDEDLHNLAIEFDRRYQALSKKERVFEQILMQQMKHEDRFEL
mmetsp:Transcript_41316/g.116956  ORF Transcript_41316/g.116956 Transcript_41316/m.116956 type:complete len:196 (+) Transcript_41316:81-668(+)